MTKNLDKIMELLQKSEEITKGDYKEIQSLYKKLDFRESVVDVIINGTMDLLYMSGDIDFKPTQLAFDP